MSLCAPVGSAVQPAETEPANTTQALSTGAPPAAATLEKIMDAAVRNISKRYDLDEDQRAITDEIMKREVRRFLKEHENEVWPVIGDLLRSRFGLEPPDSEDAKRVGKAAGPLLQLATYTKPSASTAIGYGKSSVEDPPSPPTVASRISSTAPLGDTFNTLLEREPVT